MKTVTNLWLKRQLNLAVIRTNSIFIFLIVNTIGVCHAVSIPDAMPMAMAFRSFDNNPFPSSSFTQILNQVAPYAFIHAPGYAAKATAVSNFWPNKIVTIQDAYGGLNQNYFSSVWPGHLLYQQGTLITKDVNANDQTIGVNLPQLIATSNDVITATNANFPFALTIYALNANNKPDWSKAEHVILQSMNSNILTVQRGQWGTQPLAFKAGKAVVAAHMMYWTQQWQLNFSLHCPRGGPQNQTAAEWFAAKEAQLVSAANADGIELDVARWTWGFAATNPMDANNDLIADYGYIDGINSFGLGGQLFFRELRRLLGPDKIIQADSNDPQTGVRGWQYINGVQLESFPTANDFTRFSQAFGFLNLWINNAKAIPHVSYPYTKTPTTLYANSYLPNGGNTDFRFRIGFASACLTGMPHPFASLNNINFDPANPGIPAIETYGLFPWDEYFGGDLNNWQWLGRPLGAAQQDLGNLGKTNLVANANWQWKVTTNFSATLKQAGLTYLANVSQIPANTIPDNLIFGVQLTPPNNLINLTAGNEYTLEFDAGGNDSWYMGGQTFTQVPRMIAITGASGTGQRRHPLSVLVDSTTRHYRLSFIADGSPAAYFGVSEQKGSTWIGNIKLSEGGAERWSRVFENGMVMLNMTQQPWTATVKANYYRRLKGKLNPIINNGQAVGSQVVVPPQDAVFLVKM